MEMLSSLRCDKHEFCLVVTKFMHVRSCPMHIGKCLTIIAMVLIVITMKNIKHYLSYYY